MFNENLYTAVNNLKDTINRLLFVNNWSLRTLSEKSDIPYESLKKLMNGKIANPSLNSLLKLAYVFDCSLDYLIGNTSNVSCDYNFHPSEEFDFSRLPNRSKNLLKCIANFERKLTVINSTTNSHMIPVLVPTGHMYDGMYYDSLYTKSIDISGYIDHFKKDVLCGLEITNSSLHPTYFEGDVLLVARDRHPIYGETGIFVLNNRVHIRRYLCGTPSVLEPINGVGAPIIVETLDNLLFFGYVLTVMRFPSS
jgi:transcriptional regulator with XRE-family HTH domain